MKSRLIVFALLLLAVGCSPIRDKSYQLGHYQVTNLAVDSRLFSTGKQDDLPQALATIQSALAQQLPRPAGEPAVTMHVEITSLGTDTGTYTPSDSAGKLTSDSVTTSTYRIEGVVTLASANDGHVIADSVISVGEEVGKSYDNSSFRETLFDNLLLGYSSEPDKVALYNDFAKKTIRRFYPNQ